MSEEQAYVLGTHDEEIERLGLQHRVWRARMLEAWSEAGITEGSRVLDVGCGPGYATLDLAEIVGPAGVVVALERSERFLAFARAEVLKRGFKHVQFVETDLNEPGEVGENFDAAWCRWVACFLPDINPLLSHLALSLRPGGVAIFHEYVDYGTWQTIPRSLGIESFAAKVMESWRASGGEPNIAFTLAPQLSNHGFEITTVEPLIFAVRPDHFTWRWPSSFIRSHVKRLVETDFATDAWGREVLSDFNRLESSPDSIMLTPLVLQIIARKKK